MMRAPVKLLILVHGYTPAVGGVEFLMQVVAEGLSQRGHEVTVFTTDAHNASLFVDPRQPRIRGRTLERLNGVTVRRFSVVNRPSAALRLAQALLYRTHLPGSDLARTLYQGPIVPRMVAALRRQDADIITAASWPLLHMHYPFWIRRSRRPPVVLVGAIHTDDKWAYGRASIIRLMQKADRCVALTPFEKDWLIERGVDPGRIVVIGPGIDPEPFARAAPGVFRARHGLEPEAPMIAFVGQQGEHKGVDTLLQAMPAVWDEHPTAYLVIAGARTRYSPKLERLAAVVARAHPGRVIITSELDADAKVALLRDATIFASPSRGESFGITFLEAWAGGLPVIGGRSGAVASVIADGEDGLLVTPGDRYALAQAINRLLERPELRAALARAGREKVHRQYTSTEVVRQYDALYRTLRP